MSKRKNISQNSTKMEFSNRNKMFFNLLQLRGCLPGYFLKIFTSTYKYYSLSGTDLIFFVSSLIIGGGNECSLFLSNCFYTTLLIPLAANPLISGSKNETLLLFSERFLRFNYSVRQKLTLQLKQLYFF